MMRFKFIIFLINLSLASSVVGNNFGMFLDRHIGAIENYIMEGYGKGWNYCDEISQEPNFLGSRPQYLMDTRVLNDIDLPPTFASSSCLVVSSHVKSNQSLSALIQFGWNVVRYKRLALVLKMSSGVTLDLATNTTGLPFLVAAELGVGKEQYLCPLIGDSKPRLQHSFCGESLSSITNKTLRVAVFGVPPYITYPYGGADPSFLRMVSEKLDFSFNMAWSAGFEDAISQVGILFLHNVL